MFVCRALFEGGVLSGGIRWQVLARLLGRTGEEQCHDVGPLFHWPVLPLGGPLEGLQKCLHVIVGPKLGGSAGWGGGWGVSDCVLATIIRDIIRLRGAGQGSPLSPAVWLQLTPAVDAGWRQPRSHPGSACRFGGSSYRGFVVGSSRARILHHMWYPASQRVLRTNHVVVEG